MNVGARLEMRKVSRGGLAAIKVDVVTEEQGTGNRDRGNEGQHGEHAHRETRASEHGIGTRTEHGDARDHEHARARSMRMNTSITHARAASLAVDNSRDHSGCAAHRDGEASAPTRAFQLLGEAEAAIHSIPIEKVHFHEVGAVDTIVDIVCAAAGCEALGVDRWMSSPLNVGSGTVKCQHGTLPVPAPATLALLGDAPVYAAGPPMERVTPTGAALLRMLDVSLWAAAGDARRGARIRSGRARHAGRAELLRLLVGEADEHVAGTADAEPIAVIETVIDDSTPQLLAYVSELLLEAGAWDVYRAAVQMKKGRTGVQLTVLSSPDPRPRCASCCCAKPRPSACAGGSKTRWLWRASSLKWKRRGAKCGSKSRAGPPARWPTRRRSTRTAADLAPRSTARSARRQVMQDAMRALR